MIRNTFEAPPGFGGPAECVIAQVWAQKPRKSQNIVKVSQGAG